MRGAGRESGDGDDGRRLARLRRGGSWQSTSRRPITGRDSAARAMLAVVVIEGVQVVEERHFLDPSAAARRSSSPGSTASPSATWPTRPRFGEVWPQVAPLFEGAASSRPTTRASTGRCSTNVATPSDWPGPTTASNAPLACPAASGSVPAVPPDRPPPIRYRLAAPPGRLGREGVRRDCHRRPASGPPLSPWLKAYGGRLPPRPGRRPERSVRQRAIGPKITNSCGRSRPNVGSASAP